MHTFLCFGVFMLVSGGIFVMIGKMLFVRETKAHPNEHEQNLEILDISVRLIKAGIGWMMFGLSVIIIYLFNQYLPPIQ